MRRVVFLVLVSLAALSPTAAGAKGLTLKGFLVSRSGSMTGMTGSCQCNWQWYTMGLRSGPVKLTLTLLKDGPRLSPSYTGMLSFVHNGQVLSTAQVSCPSKKSPCNRSTTVTVRVPATGIYYLLVHGEGSNGMGYRLRIQGRVYRVACRPVCR